MRHTGEGRDVDSKRLVAEKKKRLVAATRGLTTLLQRTPAGKRVATTAATAGPGLRHVAWL
ncbi:aspartate-semialdehyde dehydrogenase [Sesbania bispinosa]|nr:aspartate-semialdehyde dehydrogenase [Sesbania bispinosa]